MSAPDTRLVPCARCEGSGKEWRHAPQFDDPYLMVETREPCRAGCDNGMEEITLEPVSEEEIMEEG